jgi:hypothetical protein|mmetsp:Transcript_78256/g.131375  ORF Transcript_78256/g.131375 Transcript_78256/m.131375 type:complete len:94 (+) Transcript_78256:601-882(+)
MARYVFNFMFRAKQIQALLQSKLSPTPLCAMNQNAKFHLKLLATYSGSHVLCNQQNQKDGPWLSRDKTGPGSANKTTYGIIPDFPKFQALPVK